MHKLWSRKVPAKLLAGLILLGALMLPLPLLAHGRAEIGATAPSTSSASINAADDQDQEVEEATETRDMEKHEERGSSHREKEHGKSETDEANELAAQAQITLQEAQSTVLSANPGATIVRAGLENENGSIVYSVILSTGEDVKVDASNGSILSSDQGGDTQEEEER
jgi:uncharacterized membrane protein YkoI